MFSYDLTKIPDYETVCRTAAGDLRPATDAVIMAAHTMGIPRLTRNTAPLFYARLALSEQLGGQMLGGRPITPQDIQAHIGLTLTDSRQLTNTEWLSELEEHIVGPRLAELVHAYWIAVGENVLFLAEIDLDPEYDDQPYTGPERRRSDRRQSEQRADRRQGARRA